MQVGGEINAREIEAALRTRVDQLVPELLAGAIADRGFWCAGSVNGERGQSLKVNRSGPRVGLWTDFSASDGSDDRGGDMLQLICVVHFGGWKRGKEAQQKAIKWAKSWLGWDDLDRSKIETIRRDTKALTDRAEAEARSEAEGKMKSAWAMWRGAVPIADTPAEAYLKGRGIDLRLLGRQPGALRYLPDCWCGIRRSKHPAMIAAIYKFDEFRGVHRTYLDVSAGKGGPVKGIKVAIDDDTRRLRFARDGDRKPKSYKLTLGDYVGGCIPLWKGKCPRTLSAIAAGTAVYVSEGIEDGLSIAMARPDLRIVAGVALANMGSLALPDQAGPLVFIGQNDPLNSKAVEAFERAIVKQQTAARQANRPMPRTFFPDPKFKDFNDQLLGREMA